MVYLAKKIDKCKYQLFIGIVSFLGLSWQTTAATAQIIEDTTLPLEESTLVTPKNDNRVDENNRVYEITYEITGGAERGGNLFHSFDQFTLSALEEAFFNHDGSIDTILGRVTGGERSTIDGLIRTDTGSSTADIFLINPQGIAFGPNAVLDIGGSFIASSAETIIFRDGVEFSTANSQSAILTISQPLGLALGSNSGSIVNRGRLNVPADETIALVGNGIDLIGNGTDLTGGRLETSSGQIELASIASESSINVIPPDSSNSSHWRLELKNDENSDLRDIRLSSVASIDTSDFSGANQNGGVHLQGRQISLAEFSEIFAAHAGSAQGENIVLNASDSVILDGNSQIATAAFAEGDGGEIKLISERLEISEDSFIAALTFANGDGGNLTVDVAASIELRQGGLFAQSEAGATGAAGNLTINTINLSMQNGSDISTSTFSEGDGGNLTINASEGRVELLESSRLLAQSDDDATGRAGTLTVNATDLSIQNGSEISTSALGNGSGGNLFINTPNGLIDIVGVSQDGSGLASVISSLTEGDQSAGDIQIITRALLLRDEGRIQSGAMGRGDGGKTLINASDSVTLVGQPEGFSSGISSSSRASDSGDAGSVEIVTDRLVVRDGAEIFTSTNGSGRGGDLSVRSDEVILSGQGARPSGLLARTSGSGDSGRLTLSVDSLFIQDGARVTVSTDENAIPENLGTVRDASITARNITLNNGEITAESRSGDGGILNFKVQDFILLRNNSIISATAGTAESVGNGGNVNIDIPDGIIIAVPNENNDIIARAFSDTGGNININTQNIIGFDTRQADISSVTNDINASSEFGNDGTITLNTLEVDPTQGLVELPTNLSSPNQVAQRCLADSDSQNTFVLTGRGGTSPSPPDIVRNETSGLVDLGSTASVFSAATPATSNRTAEEIPEEPLLEAQGWHRSPTGAVTLIAQTPTQTPDNTAYLSCSHQARR